MTATGGLRALLCGYYGEHNLGDDALLQVLLQQLGPTVQPLITAHDQDAVLVQAPEARCVDRRSLLRVLWAVNRVDTVVFGGGSLLQDSTSFPSLVYYLALLALARLRGRRVLLWGQGLGPLRRPLSRWLVHALLPWCTAASWRDQASFDLAKRWAPALPMAMAPDPVWQMPRHPWIGGDAIVVSWRPTPLLNRARWISLVRALDRLASELEAPVVWLAFHHHQDADLLPWLDRDGITPSSLRRRSRVVVPESLEVVTATVQTARLVLPMRLHALILARLAGCPMAALSYDPKVEAAAVMAGVPCTDLRGWFSTEGLLAQWRGSVDQPADADALARLQAQASEHRRLFSSI
ncbi:MAG: polysaccharide pyruvyl transferase CsaB [Synechococcus sp.]